MKNEIYKIELENINKLYLQNYFNIKNNELLPIQISINYSINNFACEIKEFRDRGIIKIIICCPFYKKCSLILFNISKALKTINNIELISVLTKEYTKNNYLPNNIINIKLDSLLLNYLPSSLKTIKISKHSNMTNLPNKTANINFTNWPHALNKKTINKLVKIVPYSVNKIIIEGRIYRTQDKKLNLKLLI
jgi:hypothetical protein